MRNPAIVLNSLNEHSRNSNYKFERLYRVLFNKEMYYTAYQNIYAKTGNMTAGSDGNTIDAMSLSRIDKLIDALKDETYQPAPSRRVYILKKNGKKRPLGIPSFDDKLVQEVIRMILEAIYEKQFEYNSHGFRPNRSCHTALTQLQKAFTGAKWFIEGDIKGFFDNINHEVLINILWERIIDERFIRLLRKFMNAGYVEEWVFHRTYSGTPQGGIISPILANIYLDKLDKYVNEYIQNFNKGSKRKPTKEYEQLSYKLGRLRKKLKTEQEEQDRAELISYIKGFEKERLLYPFGKSIDTDFRKLKYVRYADDFLLGVIGSKTECEQIKEDIKNFLNDKLMLELSDEKTLITHANSPAKFLGYDVSVRKCNLTKRDKAGKLKRDYNNRVELKVTKETMWKKLTEYNVVTITTHNGTETWKPTSRSLVVNNDDLEILDLYNAQIRGFYNYYSIANNSAQIHSFNYIMQYSFFKTLAKKHRISARKIIAKYRCDKDIAVRYTDKKGETKMRFLYNGGFRRKAEILSASCDNHPRMLYTKTTTSLIDRLKARECELCGDNDVPLDMHHIKKLKDLKGQEPWKVLMHARKRKTMAVCQPCHKKIHHGG